MSLKDRETTDLLTHLLYIVTALNGKKKNNRTKVMHNFDYIFVSQTAYCKNMS